jgi:acetyl-CoA synthetase
MFRTYWKNEETYKSKFKNGWYICGDRASIDEEGYFWFIGRDKEIIKTAGQSVAPLEIERVLLEHPAVVDAAVIGIPVEKQTEIIKAFVQLKSTYFPSEKLSREILDYLGRHLESPKRPQELEFIRELPKTTTGKIRRSELKSREIEKRKGR